MRIMSPHRREQKRFFEPWIIGSNGFPHPGHAIFSMAGNSYTYDGAGQAFFVELVWKTRPESGRLRRMGAGLRPKVD